MVQVLLNADRGIKHVFNLIFQLIDSEDSKFKVLKNNAQLLFGKKFYCIYTLVVKLILIIQFFLQICFLLNLNSHSEQTALLL